MRAAATLILFLACASAQAHPSAVSGFVHPFTGLDHALALLVAGMVASRLGTLARWGLLGASLVAMAALHAYGSEYPADMEPAGYFAGFLVAGGVLQAAGVLLGHRLLRVKLP